MPRTHNNTSYADKVTCPDVSHGHIDSIDNNTCSQGATIEEVREYLTELIKTEIEGWYLCLDRPSKLKDVNAVLRTLELLEK